MEELFVKYDVFFTCVVTGIIWFFLGRRSMRREMEEKNRENF